MVHLYIFVGQTLQKVTEIPYKKSLPTFPLFAYSTGYKDVGGDTEVNTQYSGHGIWLE
jgi:hypothetical protein